MLTGETITDEQIRELRASKRSRELWSLCDSALRGKGPWDHAARARCAEILNARAVGKRGDDE